jgi:hypothetical protein
MEDLEVESVKFCRDWALRLENLGEKPSLEMSEYISGNIELLKSKHHFFIYTVTFIDV